MAPHTSSVDAIIIGCGPAGISLAYQLRHQLNFNDFIIYEKMDGIGGAWKANTYPGCGCDIPSHLYSFSFNPNPNWSRQLCEQPEILQYMNDTVDKFGLRKFIHTSVECTGAEWQNEAQQWKVQLKDLQTGVSYHRYSKIFISAVGGISTPRHVQFKGMENFTGPVFHTAEWNHDVSWKGKRVAVIGNGCSAAQAVPALAKEAAFVKQYAGSSQWFFPRPNHVFTPLEKWAFRWIPMLQRILRLSIFLDNDKQTESFFPTETGQQLRKGAEKESIDYVKSVAPKKYWDALIPKFPLGCKRRVFDPGYLECLNWSNVELLSHGIDHFTETGIVSSGGDVTDFDIIVLGTGFQVAQFLASMKIVGADTASTLEQQWVESRGAQAYYGTFVHNFPNMGILFGPNTFPPNNSAIFAIETQVDFVIKALFQPLLDGRASVVEVKASAEEATTQSIHEALAVSVFAGDCGSWYFGEFGRNAASWPGLAREFWVATFFPNWSDLKLHGGSIFWPVKMLFRNTKGLWRAHYKLILLAALVGAGSTALQKYLGVSDSLIPFGILGKGVIMGHIFT